MLEWVMEKTGLHESWDLPLGHKQGTSAFTPDPPPRSEVIPMSNRAGKVVREGAYAGIASYLAVVVVLAGWNLLVGRSPFATASSMGTYLFGASGGGAVLVWNVAHFVGSLVVGLVAAFQMAETERYRGLWYPFLMVMVAAGIYSVTVFGVFGVEIGGAIGWPEVLLGTVAWIGGMTAWLGAAHRDLEARIQEDLDRAQ